MSRKMGPRASVTIQDVARRAGVAAGTASRAVNRRGYISDDVQRRVDAAVKELGYHPDWTAQLMRGAPSRLVGLIIPDILNVHYTALARALAELLRAEGYDLILCANNDDPAVDRRHLEVLRDKRVDGIIYVAPEFGSNSDRVQEIVAGGLAMVELNRHREHLDAIIQDNFGGAELITKHFIDRGHRRIAIVVGSDRTTGKPRVAGYRTAMEDAGISPHADLVRVGAFSRAHGEAATRALLALPDRPTALFAGSNRILIGALHVLHEAGLRVGTDMSIASFNDTEWLGVVSPPITAVDVDHTEMARQTVLRLLHRMQQSGDATEKPATTVIPVQLVVRDSVKTLRVSGRH
jgi:DNA-binding LacI/PurR family transcriptional regulator